MSHGPSLHFTLFMGGLLMFLTPMFLWHGNSDDPVTNLINKMPLDKFMLLAAMSRSGLFLMAVSLLVPQ